MNRNQALCWAGFESQNALCRSTVAGGVAIYPRRAVMRDLRYVGIKRLIHNEDMWDVGAQKKIYNEN